MNKIIMLLSVVLFSACGQQLVEFPKPVADGRVCPTGDGRVCPVSEKGVCPAIEKGVCPVIDLKVDAPKVDAPKVDALKADAFQQDLMKVDMSQPDIFKPDTLQPDMMKVDALQPDLMKPDLPKPDAPKPDMPKPDLMKPDMMKPDMLQPDMMKADMMKPDAKPVNPCDLVPVVLASAGGFAVLAGSTVTNIGPTSVTGNLGLSPGTAVTGFPPGMIIGVQHTANPVSAQAQLDLTTAYNDAMGRTLCAIAVAGNLGGMTLAPGLYKSTSTLAISSGDLTLNAGGNADAVWIFQMASSFTSTSGRKIILAGGAQAKNIFWAVGSSATLGTTSVFYGTIMADQSITLQTGAALNGRALARIGAVTMDSNTVVKP